MRVLKGHSSTDPNFPSKYFVEEYYEGKERFRGIKCKEGSLELPEILGSCGLSLTQSQPDGISSLHYDANSYLFGNVILTINTKKEYFGKGDSKIKTGDRMASKIITIIGSEEEKILASARKLRLPLKSISEFI